MGGAQEAALGMNKRPEAIFLDSGGYHRETDKINCR